MVASVLVVLRAIERYPDGSPATLAYRSALRRIGLEVDAADGLVALDALVGEVVAADPDHAEARGAAVRAAWAEVLPAPAGRTRR